MVVVFTTNLNQTSTIMTLPIFVTAFILTITYQRCNAVVALQMVPNVLQENTSYFLRQQATVLLAAKGMGGIQKKKLAESNKGLKKKESIAKNGNAQPFNVNASMLRHEKKYDELMKAAAKNLQKDDDDADSVVTTEYVIAARATGYVNDWVPIAQLCIARPISHDSHGVSDPLVQAAVSCYCRELSFAASLGARIFQSIPRNLVQYAVETTDSFHKYVRSVDDHPSDIDNAEQRMSKQEARQVLELEDTSDEKSAIKQSYRKLSFAIHPDRFVGQQRTESEVEMAKHQYSRIQLAYETLSSGIRQSDTSWYQSLGGRARTDFVGPIKLTSLTTAQEILSSSMVEGAVVGLDPDLVQSFVTRASNHQ